jgi:hypothetical protein
VNGHQNGVTATTGTITSWGGDLCRILPDGKRPGAASAQVTAIRRQPPPGDLRRNKCQQATVRPCSGWDTVRVRLGAAYWMADAMSLTPSTTLVETLPPALVAVTA